MQCLQNGSWSGESAGCYLVQCHPPAWNVTSVVATVLDNPLLRLGIQYGLNMTLRYRCKYQAEDFEFGRNIESVELACGKE